jgi:hypothetical protein
MSFSSLPPELVLKIASYLEVSDLANLSSVNKWFSAITVKSWQQIFEDSGFVSVPFIEQKIRGNSNFIINYYS